ncbi:MULTISPECIES: hypothetical protein [unclassified Kitasatospora]|uniref:hypothetical protein n=1 Tax=unclassified Kitasatospora TaxID=2633591 RepID=UPI00070CEC63|nr:MULTISPECIES: hypothetical protein [unclassified Kitasatospora]KQV12389.1 hypothetical protein ASC99_34405 [Kitasatospora sp. Root107]KRB72549.1 hypothetical protein ASE03_22120 [Kitasatospora sp. Root187]
MSEQWQAPWQYGWEQQSPPPTPWEPPVTPLPSRRSRMRRRAAWAAGGVVVLAGLCWLPSACAADPAQSVLPVVDTPSPSPLGLPSPVLLPPPPPPPVAVSSSPPPPSVTPTTAPTPRQTRSPKPAKPSRTPRSSAPPSPTGSSPDLLASLQVCAEAERLGQWAPGSEQARICHSLYGG